MTAYVIPGYYAFSNGLTGGLNEAFFNSDTAGRASHPLPVSKLFTGALPAAPQPPLIASNVTLFAPLRRSTKQPPLIGPTSAISAPTTARRTSKPPLIASNLAVFVPVTRRANAVTPPAIGPTRVLFAPTKAATVKVYGALIGPTNQRFAPSARISAVHAPLKASATTVFAPSIPRRILMPFINLHLALASGTWDAVDVRWDDATITWDGNRIGTGVPIFVPKIGISDRKPPRIASNVALFGPTAVQAPPQSTFIQSRTQLFAPLIFTYALPPLIGPTRVLFPPATAPSKGTPLIASTVALFAPKLVPKASPPLISQTQLFAGGTALTIHVGGAAATQFDSAGVIFDGSVQFDDAGTGAIGPTALPFTPAVSVAGVLKPAPFIGSNLTLFAPVARTAALPPLLISPAVLFPPGKIVYVTKPGFIQANIILFAPVRTVAVFVPLLIDTVTLFAPDNVTSAPSGAAITITTGPLQLKWKTGAPSARWIAIDPDTKWRTS